MNLFCKLREQLSNQRLVVICAVAVSVALPSALRPSRVAAAERRETSSEKLPKAGVLQVTIKSGDDEISTKSLTRVVAKLEAIQKLAARRPESRLPLLVTIDVNGTTREFTDLKQALETIKKVADIVDGAKKAKVQLGELGRLDEEQSQSQQSQSQQSQAQSTQQSSSRQGRRVNVRDGDDGYGVGGGLGGQGGGGYGKPTDRLAMALAMARRGAGGRDAQIQVLRKLLSEALQVESQSVGDESSEKEKIASKDRKIGKATLFARMMHRDYQKATFSFEFGVRDDPKYLHANDWDLQYGSGGDHFHVTMVSDDRSRIVDLGKLSWEQIDNKTLTKLSPHPQPRRKFLPNIEGHAYLVHTVDRNSDHYAIFRVAAVDRQKGTCDIEWRLADVPK